MSWQFHSGTPVFLQIADHLRGDILTGAFPPGEPFPTVRQLAFEASVNPNTMQKALILLEEEGLLVTHGTVGRTVTQDQETLDRARDTRQQAFVRQVLSQAKTLGLSGEVLSKLIAESEAEI
ncbi:MAG: GntR family transcriptional regulator [Oscillospiraceae bacterium]|nr:GntR family transcriptional regulator [Oscillospiraceae bacterium]MBQ8732425.1 GntR family transcriptional regulator [Oscillospiraceae bacterium]